MALEVMAAPWVAWQHEISDTCGGLLLCSAAVSLGQTPSVFASTWAGRF